MPGRMVFLLEERSMKLLLEGLLPRLMPGWVAGQHFLCVPHEGKSDLDKSISRKLSAWKIPGDHFVVLRDNDGADCKAVLNKLQATCPRWPPKLPHLWPVKLLHLGGGELTH